MAYATVTKSEPIKVDPVPYTTPHHTILNMECTFQTLYFSSHYKIVQFSVGATAAATPFANTRFTDRTQNQMFVSCFSHHFGWCNWICLVVRFLIRHFWPFANYCIVYLDKWHVQTGKMKIAHSHKCLRTQNNSNNHHRHHDGYGGSATRTGDRVNKSVALQFGRWKYFYWWNLWHEQQ